jgi:preprotein translocase subunit SecE
MRCVVPKLQTNKKTNPIARYFRETAGEIRKVTWPTPEETTRLAVIVIIVLILSSLFLGSIDILLSQAVTRIFS